MYWLLSKADFYEADSGGDHRGPGLLLDHKFNWLKNWVNVTVQHGESVTFSEGAEDLKHGYTLLLYDFFDRLQHLPMSLEKVQLSVWETQRVMLYLQALVDYMVIYKPHMDTVQDDSMSCEADPNLVGAYTNDVHVAQTFLHAGIPIWIIHLVDQLPIICINKLGYFQEPCFFMPLEQHHAKFKPVFKGHELSAENYYAFDQFTCSNIKFPHVFTWTEDGGLILSVNPPELMLTTSVSSRKT